MKQLLILGVVCIIAIGGYFMWLSEQSAEPVGEPVPVINVMDILTATDLSAGIKQAVKKNDQQAIDEWLAKGQAVGKEAGFSERDLAYLVSDKARNYVVFNAKRRLFNEAFEARYANLQDITDLKEKYPEADDLYKQAQALIRKRDSIIEQIAGTLAEGQTVTKAHRQAAQKLWQERFIAASQPVSNAAK